MKRKVATHDDRAAGESLVERARSGARGARGVRWKRRGSEVGVDGSCLAWRVVVTRSMVARPAGIVAPRGPPGRRGWSRMDDGDDVLRLSARACHDLEDGRHHDESRTAGSADDTREPIRHRGHRLSPAVALDVRSRASRSWQRTVAAG